MAFEPGATGPFLVSFSGIDGAGKTTQIDGLSIWFQKFGLRVIRLSYWDDVAIWSKFRADVGGRAQSSQDMNEASGATFVPRNNKHVQKWYLTASRLGLYLLDVIRLRRLLASESVRNSDVVIFDRYIYDQIANLSLQSSASRAYGRMVLRQTPVPHLAFVIDASPVAAFARKPEYPLEFMYKNRQSFLRLRELAPELIIIPEGKPEEVRGEIFLRLARSRLLKRRLCEESPRSTWDSVVRQQSSCRVQNEPTTGI